MAKDLIYPFEQYPQITQGFNEINPPTYQPHGGIDFATAYIDPKYIHAAFAGEVIWGTDTKGGLCIAVYSKELDATEVFWHIGIRWSGNGAMVTKGHVIGACGHTGIYPEHTHVQFNKGRSIRGVMTAETLNPQPFFDRMQMWSPNMNIPAGSTVKVLTNPEVLRIRETPSISAKIVGELKFNDRIQVVVREPQVTNADGYEWSPVALGWIAVRQESTNTRYVEILSSDPCYMLKVENEQLKAQLAEMQKKCDAVKAIICPVK